MPYYTNGNGPDYRAYGLPNLSPLIGMGSSLAGYMGHSNIAKMLTQANGLVGQFNSAFPKGFGQFGQSSGTNSGTQNTSPAFPPNYGAEGWPFFGPHYPGLNMPSMGLNHPYFGNQGSGPTDFFHSLFGFPGTSQGGYGGNGPTPPGYFF